MCTDMRMQIEQNVPSFWTENRIALINLLSLLILKDFMLEFFAIMTIHQIDQVYLEILVYNSWEHCALSLKMYINSYKGLNSTNSELSFRTSWIATDFKIEPTFRVDFMFRCCSIINTAKSILHSLISTLNSESCLTRWILPD